MLKTPLCDVLGIDVPIFCIDGFCLAVQPEDATRLDVAETEEALVRAPKPSRRS